MEGFPDTTRALLGYKTCEEYFKQVLQHNSYCLITASMNNEIIGFVVFVVNLLETIGRRWIFKHLSGVVFFMLKHPVYVFKRLFYRIRAFILLNISNRRPSALSDLKRGSWIDIIAVKKSARKKGIGKALIMHCMNIAKERKIEYINLTVEGKNSAAIALYRSVGFNQISFNEKENSYIFSFRC